MWVVHSGIELYSILLHSGYLHLQFSPNTLSHNHIFCLHMSGIQVLLDWLREQEDKWRCAALYFHVRILFFHLIGLSSHSMWCRQWGNRKWKRRMDCNGKEMKHRHGMRGGMRLGCWWSLMKHLMRHKRMTQTETLPNIHPYIQHARRIQTMCSFMHNMTIKLSVSKVQGASSLRVQEERERESWKAAHH